LHLLQVFPNARIINTYGPTEVTAVCVHHRYAPDDEVVVIGKPDPNIHAYIVDSSLQLVPMGAPGELLLSGPRLALGYANRPDLTTEKFIPNPCLVTFESQIPEDLKPHFQLAYRTGDLVRWRANGEIEFLGRIDRQVKVNGVRIELGEVEAVLGAADGVQATVVSAVRDPQGKQKLVGYVTPGEVDTSAALEHCRSRLVASMVPSVIIALDAFPLLPNGKVDVRSLPAPEWEDSEEAFVEPATELERVVASVWMEVLRRSEPLSALSDFFTAGGTSLQVFRVTAALQKALSLESLPSSLIHMSRTVRATASALQSLLDSSESGKHSGLPPIVANKWEDGLRPLSSNQEQMWVLAESGGSVAYNMPLVLQLDGVLNRDFLQQALNAVANRHEVLRTRFELQDDGRVAGIVFDKDSFSVPLEVLSHVSELDAKKRLEAEATIAFDLSKGPMIRAVLLILESESAGSVLGLTLHHSVADAWSIGIINNELTHAYTAFAKGNTPVWEPLPIQYPDFALWQKELTSLEGHSILREYWKNSLSGCPTLLQLPMDRPRPESPTYAAGTVQHAFDAELMARLSALAKENSVNMQAVMLTGVQLLLMRYSAQDDLIIGVPAAGRDRPETHGVVGFFINTLPIRGTVNEDSSFEEMLRSVSQTVLRGMANSALPLQEIVQAVGAPRTKGANPLFQVLCQTLAASDLEGPQFDGMTCKPLADVRLAEAKFDLSFFFGEDGGLVVEYMTELFEKTTVERMVESLTVLLAGCAASPNSPVLSLPMLSNTELDYVAMVGQGPVREDYLSAPLIHQLFEAQAAWNPSRTCLVYEGVSLSYGEVNAKANTLARVLRKHGVEKESIVGIMLDRSPELIIAILATLKAGGGYLPVSVGGICYSDVFNPRI
jgi:non-ribosomal peptide synthetase component F